MRKFFMSLSILALGGILVAISIPGFWGAGNPPVMGKNINQSRFYVLLFPTQEQIADSSGKIHTVERAALSSIPELSENTFTLFIGEAEHEFDASNFSLFPKSGDLERYVQNYNDQLKNWGTFTDWQSASFEVQEPDDTSPARAKLTLIYHDGRPEVFIYEIDALNKLTPLSVKLGAYPGDM